MRSPVALVVAPFTAFVDPAPYAAFPPISPFPAHLIDALPY